MARHWSNSLEHFQKAWELEPYHGRDEFSLTLAARLAAQPDAYQENLRRLHVHLRDQDPGFINGIWVSLLDKDLATTAPWALERTQQMAEELKHLEYQLPVAYAHVRFGRAAEGLLLLEQLETLIKDRPSDPDGRDDIVRFAHQEFVLAGKALACWQLGKVDEARHFLDEVETRLRSDAVQLGDHASPPFMSLEASLILQEIRNELRRLVTTTPNAQAG